jgi:nucleotide-binding universal stress UspA family protein
MAESGIGAQPIHVAKWIARETERLRKATEGAAEKLGSAGLNISIVVGEREPNTLLCSEADDFMDDRIFVGLGGMGRLDRFLIGNVSLGVAARSFLGRSRT